MQQRKEQVLGAEMAVAEALALVQRLLQQRAGGAGDLRRLRGMAGRAAGLTVRGQLGARLVEVCSQLEESVAGRAGGRLEEGDEQVIGLGLAGAEPSGLPAGARDDVACRARMTTRASSEGLGTGRGDSAWIAGRLPWR